MWTDWGPNTLITSPSLSPFFCPIQQSTNSLIQFGAARLESAQRRGAPAADAATSFIRQPAWFIYYGCVFPLCLLITSWGWNELSEILMRVSPRGWGEVTTRLRVWRMPLNQTPAEASAKFYDFVSTRTVSSMQTAGLFWWLCIRLH